MFSGMLKKGIHRHVCHFQYTVYHKDTLSEASSESHYIIDTNGGKSFTVLLINR